MKGIRIEGSEYSGGRKRKRQVRDRTTCCYDFLTFVYYFSGACKRSIVI